MTIYFNPKDSTLHDDGGDDSVHDLPLWPQGMTVATPEQINPPITLAAAQTSQLAIIAAAFAAASAAPVADSTGLTWSGGFDSAQNIYGAAQLAQAGGATNVTIFDAGNIGHSLTIAQATAVAASVCAAYQSIFGKYQGMKVKIAAATTVAEVQAIAW